MIGLRTPTFGNSWISDSKSSIFTSLDGETIIATSPLRVRRIHVAFEALTEVQATNLRNFMIVTAGESIQIEDHERNLWDGFILDPSPEIVSGRDSCQYRASFTFEGQITGVAP